MENNQETAGRENEFHLKIEVLFVDRSRSSSVGKRWWMRSCYNRTERVSQNGVLGGVERVNGVKITGVTRQTEEQRTTDGSVWNDRNECWTARFSPKLHSLSERAAEEDNCPCPRSGLLRDTEIYDSNIQYYVDIYNYLRLIQYQQIWSVQITWTMCFIIST